MACIPLRWGRSQRRASLPTESGRDEWASSTGKMPVATVAAVSILALWRRAFARRMRVPSGGFTGKMPMARRSGGGGELAHKPLDRGGQSGRAVGRLLGHQSHEGRAHDRPVGHLADGLHLLR